MSRAMNGFDAHERPEPIVRKRVAKRNKVDSI